MPRWLLLLAGLALVGCDDDFDDDDFGRAPFFECDVDNDGDFDFRDCALLDDFDDDDFDDCGCDDLFDDAASDAEASPGPFSRAIAGIASLF